MQAKARHILVKTTEDCERIKEQIESGVDFAELAETHSECPSGKRGGDLGSSGRGQMVREFDEVVFNQPLGMVHGPVRTQFGFHLIEIVERTE